MVLNEILTKQNVLGALLLKEGENELSKELKVKIVRMRIAYNKIKTQFDADVAEFEKTLIPDELKKLQEKKEDERTSEENDRMQELINKVNSEYNEFMMQKGNEEVEFTMKDSFTDAEFDEIVGVNAGNDVEINKNKIKAEQLMEFFYTLFVTNDESNK